MNSSTYRYYIADIFIGFLWPALKPTIKQLDPKPIEVATTVRANFEVRGDLLLEPCILFQVGPAFATTFAGLGRLGL